MSSIVILRRSLFPQDAELFRRAFEAGLLATGSSVEGREISFHGGGRDIFHVMFRPGEDSLDCHAYQRPGVSLNESVLAVESSNYDEARRVIEGEHAIIGVEPDPPFPLDGMGFRRTAVAVSELLDSECVAIVAFRLREESGSETTYRFAMCTPETPSLLRSADPSLAFADGIEWMDILNYV